MFGDVGVLILVASAELLNCPTSFFEGSVEPNERELQHKMLCV